MALLELLKDAYGADGFDLDAALAGARTAFDDANVTTGPLDLGPVLGAAAMAQSVDVDGLGAAVSTVAAAVGAVTSGAGAGDVLAPLVQKVGALETLARVDGAGIAAILRTAPGDDKLETALNALGRLGGPDVLGVVTSLAPSIQPGALLGTTNRLAGAFVHVLSIVNQLAELASASTIVNRLGITAAGLTGATELETLSAALRSATSAVTDVTAAVGAVDPDDEVAIAPVISLLEGAVTPVADALAGLRSWFELTVALVEAADLPALTTAVDGASTELRSAALAPIAEAARSIRSFLDPLVRFDPGPGLPDLETFVGELRTRQGPMIAVLDAVDLGAFASRLAPRLDQLLAPVRALDDAAHEAVTAVQAALEGVRRAVAAIDLRPVTDALGRAADLVGRAAAAVRGGVAELAGALEQAVVDVNAVVGTVRTAVAQAEATVAKAFAAVQAELAKVDLAAVQEQIDRGAGAVAAELTKVQLGPYFDTTTRAIDTATDVVGAVPLALLPDDVRSELDAAIAPIKAIDFQGDVATPLRQALDEILAELDTAVIGTLRQAYEQLLGFLREIDPTAAIGTLQTEGFEPLMARLRSVDPHAVLAPAIDAVAAAKRALATIDIDAVLEPLDSAVATVADAVRAFDPAALVEPLAQRLDTAREAVARVLALDRWPSVVEQFVTQLSAPIAAIDEAMLTRLVDQVIAALDRAAPAPTPTARTLAVVADLGDGLTAAATSLVDVVDWVGGRQDPVEMLATRFDGAARNLRASGSTVAALDIGQVPLDAALRDLAAALARIPPASRLRAAAEPIVARVAPDGLAGLADVQRRSAGALDAAADLAAALARAGRSELQVVARGLQQALAPIREVTARLHVLLRRCGAAPADDPVLAIRALLQTIRASDVFAPLVQAVARLVARIPAGARQGLVTPVTAAAAELQQLLATIDIRFITAAVAPVQAEVAAKVASLRPSEALSGLVAPTKAALAELAALDVLAPVQAAVSGIEQVLDDLENLAPATVLAPATDVYRTAVTLAGGLDVDRIAQPILDGLDSIANDLEDGLDEASAALSRLQAALP